MELTDEERIGHDDRVLVVITNQYMFDQVMWYHSKYPEGIWDAVIIHFGGADDGKELMNIMFKKCNDSGFFSSVLMYDKHVDNAKLLKKGMLMVDYIIQYITFQRDKYDKYWVESVLVNNNYQKVIIQSTFNRFSVAVVNTFKDNVLIRLEDGMIDYCPAINVWQVRCFSQILWLVLAKLNIVSPANYGRQFKLKYDNRTIKYCSMPERMQYKNYKKIKQLFEEKSEYNAFVGNNMNRLNVDYDVIVFSTPFEDLGQCDYIYDVFHKWLKENYRDKKILIKPHPREKYRFEWSDLDITVGCLDISGENVLDLFPNVELLFLKTSAILLKVYRMKRPFKVIYFKDIKSRKYRKDIESDCNILGITDEHFILV